MSFHDEFVRYAANNNINIPSLDVKLDQLKEFEKAHRKPVESGEYTRDDYLAYFRFTAPRSPSFFGSRKTFIKHYISFLVEKGAVDSNQLDILSPIVFREIGMSGINKIQYFKDITHLMATISQTLDEEHDRRTDAINDGALVSQIMKVYDLPVCVIYCIWYGLTLEQIVEIKTTDVKDDGIVVDGSLVYMSRPVVKKLKDFINSDGFVQPTRSFVFRPYVASEYLIRSNRSAQLSVPGVRALLVRFNNLSDNKYAFNFETIYSSGQFYRAYVAEQNGLVNFKSVANKRQYFGDKDSSESAINARYMAYLEYKRTFFAN